MCGYEGKQFSTKTRMSCALGQPEKIDSECERNDVAGILMVFESLAGKHETIITETWMAVDFANAREFAGKGGNRNQHYVPPSFGETAS